MAEETLQQTAEALTLTDDQATAAAAEQYRAENIQVLKNAAHVRQNPGMYIGDVGSRGLHHLVYEVVHNSVDEAMAGFCKNIHVTINVDGSITVADDGRGIPVEEHPTEKKSTLEIVMTEVGAGGKFRKDTYKVSAGLHGIGVKAVNALSEWTEVQVSRDGKVYQQEYERGRATTSVEARQGVVSKRNGTRITFLPDPEVFHETKFNYDTLEGRLRELAFLNKGLCIALADERDKKEEKFKYDGGIKEYVEYLNRDEDALHKAIYIEDDRDDVHVEAAFQYNAGEEERVYSYVNNVHTPVGGTHLSGFRSALTRTINHYGSKEGLIKENLTPIGEDFREGLTAIISVRVAHPQFESQTKIRLNNPEVEGVVTSVVNEHLSRFLEENPAPAKKIVQKIMLTAEAREAAAKAKKQLKDRKTILSGNGLPGKLMDCTSKNRDECELFLVEGDSAGGSADGGRDRMYQAILPLRGKILNVEKARVEKMLDNTEICNMISAIGTDIGIAEDVSKRNYEKIIVLTDADVDGSHIRTLLLTFLYRQMPTMIRDGHVYLAQPPLFRVIHKKQTRYVQTNEEMARELLDRGLQNTRVLASDGATERPGAGANSRPVPPSPAPPVGPSLFEGARLRQLIDILMSLENALQILDRRGLSLGTLLQHAKGHQLPQFRVFLEGLEHWFHHSAEMDAFCKAESDKRGQELLVAGGAPEGSNGQQAALEVQELHEVKSIMKGLDRLRELGLEPDSLLPPKSVAGQEPLPRFRLEHEEVVRPIPCLRDLVPEIRRLGEKGMSITRFKGLGEMNPEELWDTTLDPAKRTLLQVRLEDAARADEMFRVLMGDKVEPRRAFIEKHALEVRNLDV
jgi:DNA gyrase subunit B